MTPLDIMWLAYLYEQPIMEDTFADADPEAHRIAKSRRMEWKRAHNSDGGYEEALHRETPMGQRRKMATKREATE